MNSRLEQVYSRKLEDSLSSHHRFPINLEWLVDLFKYKHISSLTTHLKRHFVEKVDYKRIPEGQNKRTWSYHITVDCFSRICHYCRHSERKIVAKFWLRRIMVIRRENHSSSSPRSRAFSASLSSDDEDDEDEEDEEDEDEEMEQVSEEDDDEEEEEDSESFDDISEEDSSTQDDLSSPESSPRYPSPNHQPTMVPITVQIPQSDGQHSLDWSYLKLRSYDLASIYHMNNGHHIFHQHHHCYVASHQPVSSPYSHSPLSLSAEIFRPSEEEMNEYDMDTAFDTNAFLSIPDDADDEASPR